MKKDMRFTFGFIGTFGPWHGIEVLEQIIPTIILKNKNVHFLLMGDGILREGIEKSCVSQGLFDHVTFTGKIPQDKAPEYLAACDAFLCPTQPNADGTRFFGSPTKLFEYMSMAKPIIASDLEQLAQVIYPAVSLNGNMNAQECRITNEVGFLVRPSDIQGFIDASLFCVDLPEVEREKMGVNARQKVLNQYTWKQHVQRIIDHAGL